MKFDMAAGEERMQKFRRNRPCGMTGLLDPDVPEWNYRIIDETMDRWLTAASLRITIT